MEDDITYRVLVNAEDQYSLWPAHLDIPAGWTFEGTEGPRDACTAHVDQIWTDMRPRTLRERMDSV
ncbi:MbtH family protein [Actinokineospora sp. 24-640]